MTTDVIYIYRGEQLNIGNNNQSKNKVDFLRNSEKDEMRWCVL